MEENKTNEISTLLDMVQGAVKEIINDNVADILINIKDPNTDLKARELIVKVKLTPQDEARKIVNVTYDTNKKTRPIKPIATAIAISHSENGQMQAVELLTQLSGQVMMSGGEVPHAKVVNFKSKAAQ